jgi:hypothetical protein
MIYYLIIPNRNAIIQNNYIATYISNAINNHSSLVVKPPVLMNEPICFLVVTDVKVLEKIDFKKSDEVRLCLSNSDRYTTTNNFDLNNLEHTMNIFKYIKEQGMNICSTVAYV